MASIITNDKVQISFGNGHGGGSSEDGNTAYIPCKNCKGCGRIPDGNGGTKICPVCKGTGRVPEE